MSNFFIIFIHGQSRAYKQGKSKYGSHFLFVYLIINPKPTIAPQSPSAKNEKAMSQNQFEQDLLQKTLKKIGKDVSLFRCEGKEILSVEDVGITKMEKPTSSKKQTLSFDGKVRLRLKMMDGYTEETYPFLGAIEVMNYSSFFGLKGTPFICKLY